MSKPKNQKPGCLISIIGFFGTILISLLLTAAILATTVYSCYRHTLNTLPETLNRIIYVALDRIDKENDYEISKGLDSIGYELKDIYPEKFVTSVTESVIDNIFYGKKTPVDFSAFTDNYREIMADLTDKGIDLYVDSLQKTDLKKEYNDINKLFKDSYNIDLSEYIKSEDIEKANDRLSSADFDKIREESKTKAKETVYTASDKLMDEKFVDELNHNLNEMYEDEDLKEFQKAIEQVESNGILAICGIFLIVLLFALIHFFMYSQKHRAVRNFSICFFFAGLIHLTVCIVLAVSMSELKKNVNSDSDKEIAELATDIVSRFTEPFKLATTLCFVIMIALFVISRIMKRKERNAVEEEDILELKG